MIIGNYITQHGGLGGVGVDDHHDEAHTVASHSDTTGTGAELDTLTDGSNAEGIHIHGLLVDLGTEQLEGSSVVGANAIVSVNIQAKTDVHRQYLASFREDVTGENVVYGSWVTAAEAVQVALHGVVIRQEGGNDHISLVNGSAAAQTVFYQVVEVTQ